MFFQHELMFTDFQHVFSIHFKSHFPELVPFFGAFFSIHFFLGTSWLPSASSMADAEALAASDAAEGTPDAAVRPRRQRVWLQCPDQKQFGLLLGGHPQMEGRGGGSGNKNGKSWDLFFEANDMMYTDVYGNYIPMLPVAMIII